MKIWPNFAKIKLKVLGEFGEHPRLVIFALHTGDLMYVDFIMETFIILRFYTH